MKYCFNCKHFKDTSTFSAPRIIVCAHPSITINLVTGKQVEISCFNERSIFGTCGISGELFEEREIGETKTQPSDLTDEGSKGI